MKPIGLTLCLSVKISKSGLSQVVEQGEVYGGEHGHVMKVIKLQLEKKKEKNKNQVDQGKCIKYVFVLALKTPYWV